MPNRSDISFLNHGKHWRFHLTLTNAAIANCNSCPHSTEVLKFGKSAAYRAQAGYVHYVPEVHVNL